MRKAFTLLELLLVIAILAVLAALLFPVLTRSLERARGTHCVANLRQIGAAVNTYMADWDDRFPWARSASAVRYNDPPNIPGWYEVLAPYVHNQHIWKCPSDTGETHTADPMGFRQRTPPLWASGSSYEYPGASFAGVVLAGRPTSFAEDSSRILLSFEYRPWYESYDPKGTIRWEPARMKALYCDGHITRRTWKELERDRNWGQGPRR